MAITDIIEEKELTAGAPSIKYEGDMNPDQGSGIMEMASMESGQAATLEEIYFELIADGMDPESASIKAREIYNDMSSQPQDMMQEPRTMAMNGGIMGHSNGSPGNTTFQLAKKRPDGKRPGYYGSDAGFGDDDYKDEQESFQQEAQDRVDAGGSGGGSEQQFTDTKAAMDARDNAKEQEEKDRKATVERERIAAEQKEKDRVQTLINNNQKLYADKKQKQKRFTTLIGDTKPLDLTEEERLDLYDDNKDGKVSFLESLGEKRTNFAKKTLDKSARKKLGVGPEGDLADYFAPDFDMGLYGMSGKELTRAQNQAEVAGQDRISQDDFDNVYGYQPVLPMGEGRGAEQQIIPITKKKEEEEVEEEEPFQLGLAFRADGGRVGKAYGGSMGDDGRRAYGLGSIFKKATKALKKVVKSPIGKAALMYYGGNFLSGLGGTAAAKTGGGFNWRDMVGGMFKNKEGGLSPFKIAGTAATLAPFLFQEEEDDESKLAKDNTGFDVDETRRKGGQGEMPYSNLLYAMGGRVPAQEGGPMGGEVMEGESEELLDMNGMEKDYREDGGFVPLGEYEKKDDVPARLSKNEFVFTADAVRGAGEGDVDLGAEKLYTQMKELESVGKRMQGANEMFQTSQRLEEVV